MPTSNEEKKEIYKNIREAALNQAIESDGEKVEKELPNKNINLKYEAWSKDMIEEYPVTPKLLGKRVMLARKSRSRFTLKGMFPPNSSKFPQGGYILESSDGMTHHCHLDEVKCLAKDKPKEN